MSHNSSKPYKSKLSDTGFSKPVNDSFNRRFVSDNSQLNLVPSEEDKEKNDYELVKRLVFQHEELGRRQILANRDKILKNQNLAAGVIDQNDYIKAKSGVSDELDLLSPEADPDYELKFYPIIPVIVNTMTSTLSKTKVSYGAYAVNLEAQNEILDKKNEEVKNLLISKAMDVFNLQMQEQGIEPQTDGTYEKQLEIFQALPKIQKYYNSSYRLPVEMWANHKIESTKRTYNIPFLEQELFRNKIICDRPFIHSNLLGDSVRPEILRPDNCAYLRSPNTSDVSEGYMFMWYEYHSPISILQKYGDKLSEEDVDKLKMRFLPTRFTTITPANREMENMKQETAEVQNFLAFRSEKDTMDRKYRGEEYRDNLIEVVNMYLQVPRKLKKVTMMSEEGQTVSFMADKDYKPVFKPTYLKGKPKLEHFLVSGEHVEPVYINELWRVEKINFSRNPNPNLNHDIWVTLEKYPVQISDPRISRYGSLIPVNGGPTTNKYSVSSQIVDKTAPGQIMFNYLWNRIDQILETEIGPFFLMNQNILPSESMDGSWGKNNYIKFLLTARDTGVGLTDLSPANAGPLNQVTGGFGQKIDMSRTSELIEKVQLAQMIKQECYSVLGISPQFLADISASETATGITQGIQRSVTALKSIYDEHYYTMERFWQVYLEISKYVSTKSGSVQETYVNSEAERIIFQTSAAEFPLYQLGVFTTSSFDDALLLAEIQQMVKFDNTLGADTQEKISLMTSTGIGEIHSKLKDLQARKEAQIKQQQEAEMQKVQADIEARERMKEKELAWEREKTLLELESEENIQEMKVIGQSSLAQGTGLDELIKLKNLEMQEKDYYNSIVQQAQANLQNRESSREEIRNSELKRMSDANLEREKLKLKREEIAAKLKISKTQLDIARENKNSNDRKPK